MHYQCAVEVFSTAAPPIRWRCSRCDRPELFDCRETFRLNANGKVIDVWSLYGCRSCDLTHKLAVVERVPLSRLDPALRVAAEANDPILARRCGRDLAILRRNDGRLAGPDRWVSSPASVGPLTEADSAIVEVRFPEPLVVPMVAVMSRLFEWSNSRVRRGLATGALSLKGTSRHEGLRLWSRAEIEVHPLADQNAPPEPMHS